MQENISVGYMYLQWELTRIMWHEVSDVQFEYFCNISFSVLVINKFTTFQSHLLNSSPRSDSLLAINNQALPTQHEAESKSRLDPINKWQRNIDYQHQWIVNDCEKFSWAISKCIPWTFSVFCWFHWLKCCLSAN